MDKLKNDPKENHEDHHLLLDALKNKFKKTQSENGSMPALYSSPTKFTIPTLQENTLNISPMTQINVANNIDSPLNQFLLGQLQKTKQTNGYSGLTLPKLQVGEQRENANEIIKFEIPLLNRSKRAFAVSNIDGISSGIDDLKLNDSNKNNMNTRMGAAYRDINVSEEQSHTIDLTTALNVNHSPGMLAASTASTSTANMTLKATNFDIPFIECDRQHKKSVFEQIDQYCQMNIGNEVFKHVLVVPSAVGRVFCGVSKYTSRRRSQHMITRDLRNLNHCLNPENQCKLFKFDTKSPDEFVQSSLNKCIRTSHT